jgi:CRP/FNR family cyclic AMP-dependent transcriptional regulator
MQQPLTVIETLSSHPFLTGFTPQQLEMLSGMACEASFGKNELIFRQGDHSSFFYLLLEGTVALEVPLPNRTIRIQTVGAGEELGWSSLMTPMSKQFQARSLEPVHAVAFDGARLRAVCENECQLGYALMRRVLEVVAERLQNTRLQLVDMYSPGGTRS